MTLPKMILFDYGQTLGSETFNGVKGTEAVMKYAVKNKFNYTAEQVQNYVAKLNSELGRFDPKTAHFNQIEIPNSMFQPYLYESLGIEINLTNVEKDRIFWNNAAPAVPTDGIVDFLKFLKQKNIRTGVITNICYDPSVVEERINNLLPNNEFEFIIASSNYIFRKPSRHIFELALLKADLEAKDVWFIGDNYECDVKGSAEAGMFPVWYTGAKNGKVEPDESVLTINSWEKLKIILENLEKC